MNLNTFIMTDFQYEDVACVEELSDYEQEYVYDIEVDDDTHTFITNDILVHNSVFVGFQPVIDSLVEKPENDMKFIKKFYDLFLKNWFDEKLEKWSQEYGAKNLHNFEMERIAKTSIWVAKKAYIQDPVWEDGVEYESMSNLLVKGLTLIKSSTPEFAREKLLDVVMYLIKDPENVSQRKVHRMLKDLRQQFDVQEIEAISSGTQVSNYKQRVLNDQTELKFVDKTHFSVKAAAYHNYLLHQNPTYKKKYNLIGNEKIKYYVTVYADTEPDKKYFAFTRGSFPREIAPPMDYDAQFENAVLKIINTILKGIGMSEFDKKLSFTQPLLL